MSGTTTGTGLTPPAPISNEEILQHLRKPAKPAENVQLQPVDFGIYLKPELKTAITTEVLKHLRLHEEKPEPAAQQVYSDELSDAITRSVRDKVQENFGIDAPFWHTLYRDPAVRDKLETLALKNDDTVKPLTDFMFEQYGTLGTEIAASIKKMFPEQLKTPTQDTYWKKRQTEIQKVVEGHIDTKAKLARSEYDAKLNGILKDAGLADDNKREEAKKALFNAVAKRNAELTGADQTKNNQLELDKKKAAEKPDPKKSQAQQQQQAAEGGSDFDSWMQQRKYQGQNLVVSMVLALVISKFLSILEWTAFIATGNTDGILRKLHMLEYQGMTYDQQLASEFMDPFHSVGGAPRAGAEGSAADVQGGATAAQQAAAQAQQQSASAGQAAQAAAARPQFKPS